MLFINILPSVLLFIIFFGNYNIIESLLTTEAKTLWFRFFLALSILTGLQLSYLIFSSLKKRQISVYYALSTLILYGTLIYCYSEYSSLLIPGSVPNWMVSSDAILYPGTFLMPTLAHALFILVITFSTRPTTTNALLSFLYGIAIPIAGYLFVQIILPLWQKPEAYFGTHALIILFIAASTLFLFFICRGIYILTTLQSEKLLKYAIYWKILIALLLPLLGLCISNGLFLTSNGLGESIFGNFKHLWFYIIAILNGLLICLPAFKNNRYRLFRFLGLIVCFPYSIYFFLVFLPYLPLAIVAVVAIGIGFLMLAPLFLFVLQLNELYKEFNYLRQNYPPVKINVGIIAAINIIPLVITGYNLRDKKILNNALTYVYHPDHSKTYSIDRKSLFNTLVVIRANKGTGHFSAHKNTPFISAYYNWLVLDNMILSDVKINTLAQIFFGEKQEQPVIDQNNSTNNIKISKVRSTSWFDHMQQSWISTVDLELTNPDAINLASYETEFTLPEGCWISNYYLNIGNRREMGILAEKKSALWVFSQIRNENRDPGILYYLTGSKVALKIFPFAAKEIRKSGIEFVHKSPVTLNFGDTSVSLGTAESGHISKIESINHTTYIPASEKTRLTLVKRKPVYHFIIDASEGKTKNIRSYMTRIRNFVQIHQLKSENIRLNLTNSFSHEIFMNSSWRDKLSRHPFEGGFYLDGAVKKILVNNYNSNKAEFPVMIVLTDSLTHAIIHNDFSDFKITYPEGPDFYELDADHKLWKHALNKNPKLRLAETFTLPDSVPVYAWPAAAKPEAYLPNDNQPSIVVKAQASTNEVPVEKKSWLSGLNLQGMWTRNIINDDLPENFHVQLVKQSMMSKVLCPSTSFLAVENKAQKMALLKKQEQILAGNKNLDPDEETQSMAEPNLYLLVALLCMVFSYKFRKKLFISHSNVG